MPAERYCATCRRNFPAATQAPPYGAVHEVGTDNHYDPISGEALD